MKKAIKKWSLVIGIIAILFVVALHLFPAFEMQMHRLLGWY